MQLLRSTGISQYAEIDPSTMVDLAMSGLSDNEILQASVDMADVRAVNEMIDNLSNWHKPAQQAHYNQLPEEMKSRLSEQGYVPPDDREGSKAGFWKRTLWPGYWDDNVHDLVGAAPYVGDALAAGTRAAWFLPSKAFYFGVNRPIAGLWNTFEKVGRFSQRASRTYLRMREDGFTSNPVTFLRDPERAARANLSALDAWRSTEHEGSSFTREAEEEARDILNDDRLWEIAQLTFRHKGVEAGAWEFFAAQGEAEGLSPEDPKIYDRWLDFLTTMEEEVPRWDDAVQVLTDNTVDPVSWSIRKYDNATDNLRHLGGPGSWTADLAQRDGIISPHTVIALGAALVGEMAFDPTTYSPFIVKNVKNAAKVALKTGMSGGDVLKSIDLMHRITATSRAIRLLETGSDLTPALKTTLARPGRGQVLGPVTHAKLSETIVELSGWAADHGVNWLGQTSGFLLRAGNRSNAYIDRVTDAFAKYDRWILERTKILAARPGLSDRQLEAAVLEALRVEGITAEPLTALVNDLPELGTLIESMRGWHIQQRNYMTELLDSKGARMTLRKKGLSEFDGYWEFLSEVEGQRALFTGMGGHNTGGIFFPETTWKNVVRMRTKSWATGFLAKGEKSFFDAAGDVIKADIGELSGEFLAARESILLDALERRFGPTGSLSLSRTFSRDELSRVLAGDKKALETFQISDEDFNVIIGVARELAPTMAKRVKDSGLVDDFFIFHEGAHGVTKFDDASRLAAAPRRKPLFRHGRNFTETLRHNLHRPGSMNAEASWIDKALAPVANVSPLASSILFEAMYHPVNFARKFTVHVPKSTVLDVTDTKTAVAEFKAAVEMGLMADMPREVINSYLTAFTYGTSAQRWDVATKFFLDFMGRSGMLVHGGKNVDEWVKKFIAQSDYTYSNIGLDFHSISNVKTKRALIAGEANAGQISKMNVIPDWGEMAKAARYMSIYRYLGHMLGASQIDQIFRRFWKPAVLMRVGVAIRNGADEALGFLLREGPLAYTNSKLARVAQNSAKTWDEYGRPLWINLDGADDTQSAARSAGISHEARIPLEVRRALLIKPFTRIMRTVNDWTGVGDFAVTRKAIRKAMDDTGHSWALMRADEQQAAIKTARDSLMADMGPRGQVQRGLFDFADGVSQRSAYYMHELAVTKRLPGSRPSVAKSLLEMQGESAIQLARAKAIQMTNPTLMQAAHERVFGAYKTYYGGTSGDRLDEHIRSLGFGKSGDVLPYIPLDYASSEVRWISKGMDVHQATPVDILDAADYQIRLHADAPESIAAVRELSHYIDPGTESYFQDLIQRTLGVPSQTIGEKGTTASRHALEIFRKATNVDEFSPSFLLHLRRAAAEALPDGKFRVAIHGYTDWDSGSSALVEKIREVYGDGPAEFIHDLLFRTDLGGNHLGQQPLAFLLNGSIDSSRLSADAASIEKRMQIAHRAVLAEPDSYQRVQSLSRIGGSEPNAVRTMPPATPQEIRLFFPVLPVEGEHIKILTHILSGGAATKDYLKAIRAGIETEFVKVGIPVSQVDIFLKNLHPHSNPMGSPGVTGADALQQLAISYGQAQTLGGPYFPLPVGSANPMVAEAISRGWDRAMDTILGGATRSPKRAVNAETSTPRVMARLFGRSEYDATSGFGKFYGSRTGHTIERAGVKSRHEAVPKRIYLQGDSAWGSDIEIPPGFVRFENAAGEPILSASGSVQFIHPSNLVDTSKGPASLGEALVDVAKQPAEDALSLSVTAQEERLALLHGLENLADESVVMVPAYTTQKVAVPTKVNEKLKIEHPFASARQSLVREKHRVWTPRKLKDNQVIVFSSDIDGRHEKAARIVMDSGAVRGQGRGRQGQSYAITTWDPARSGPAEGYTVGNTGTYVKGGAAKPNSNYVNSIYGTVVPTKRSMTGDEIHEQLLELVEHAKENPETEFLLTPIGVGPGKGNFTYENINELIQDIEFPDNVIKTWYSKELEETGDLPPRFIDITRTKTTAGGPSVTAAAPGKGDEFTRTVMDLVEALNDGATDEQIAAILGLPVELVERISTGKRSLLVEQVAPLDNAPNTVSIANPYEVFSGDETPLAELPRWERAGLSEKPPRYKGPLEGVDKDGDPVRFIDDDPDFLRRIGLSEKEVENGAWVKIHKKDTLGALTPRQSKRALRGVDLTGEAGLRENVYLATGNIKIQGKVIKPKPRPGRRKKTVTTVTRNDVPGGEVDQVWLRNYRLQKLAEMHEAGDIDEVVVFDRGTAFEGTDPSPALSGPGVHPDMVGARLAPTPTKFRSDPELQRFAEKHGTLRDREGFVSPEKKRVRHRMQTVGDTGHARTFHTWDPDLQMPVTPRDVGGFGDRLIVGVAPGQMSGNGVDVIHTLNDSPQVAIQRLYKEKSTGNYTWSRAGAPEDLERYKNTDDWELVDEQYTSLSDMEDSIKTLSIESTRELVNLLSTLKGKPTVRSASKGATTPVKPKIAVGRKGTRGDAGRPPVADEALDAPPELGAPRIENAPSDDPLIGALEVPAEINVAGETVVKYSTGENQILSNFQEAPFEFRGVTYRTAEGAYQDWKTGQRLSSLSSKEEAVLEAQRVLALQAEAFGRSLPEDPIEALKTLARLAESNDPSALFPVEYLDELIERLEEVPLAAGAAAVPDEAADLIKVSESFTFPHPVDDNLSLEEIHSAIEDSEIIAIYPAYRGRLDDFTSTDLKDLLTAEEFANRFENPTATIDALIELYKDVIAEWDPKDARFLKNVSDRRHFGELFVKDLIANPELELLSTDSMISRLIDARASLAKRFPDRQLNLFGQEVAADGARVLPNVRETTNFPEMAGATARRHGAGKSPKIEGDANVDLMREILEAKYDQVREFQIALDSAGTITHPVQDEFWANKFPELLESLKEGKKPEVKPRGMRKTKVLSVERVRENPKSAYLFADSLSGKGKRGQAVIRDEPNAFGIPVKKTYSGRLMHFSDDDFVTNKEAIDAAFDAIPDDMDVVVPSAGLGSGAAKLEEKAPKTFAYIESKIEELRLIKPAPVAEVSKIKEARLPTPFADKAAETTRTSSGTKVKIEGATAEYWPQEDLGITYDQVDEIISGQTPVGSGTSGWEPSRLSPKNKPLSRVVGDEGLSYHYTGSTYKAEAWPEEIQALREQIEELTGYEFDLAIIQKYPDGSTDLGWHWDTEYIEGGVRVAEPGRGVSGEPEGVIVSVNFGATRKFEFRPRKKPSGTKYGYKEERAAAGSVDLGDGDILLMSGGTQGNLEHRIVKETGQVGPRINITFRQVGKSHRSPRRFRDPSEPPLPKTTQATSGVAQPTMATSPEMRSTLSPSETRVNHAWTLELAPLPHGEVVPNAHQIHAYADMSLVPDGLVMRVPVAAKKTIGDRITDTFGAFFEGVMSPIVGALAREPMFDYYFAKALEITRPFRNHFNHEPKAFDSFFAFDDGLAIGARKLDDGQVVIEDLEDYIMFDMPNKTIDPDSKETALGDLLEARRHAHDPYDKSLREFLKVELGDAFVQGGPGTPDDVENIIGQIPMVSGRFSDVFPEMDSVFIKMFEEDPDQLDLVIKQLMDYMNFKFTQNQAHVDVAAERALHQTSLFIDDHNLRSQFQESVGSLVPFWFAEDQFLRRWARTMQENPAALRQLQVGLNASTRAGLITEDSEGNRRLIIPGTEMFVKMVFEVLGEIPVVRDYFGADVGYVGGDLSLGLNTILPGYDLDTVGQLGFGPLLSMPILAASQRDPSLRGEGLWGFGDNMVSRFGYDQSAGELMWSSVMPLPLSRTAAIVFGWQMPMSEGRIKAETDAIMLMALNESLPTEEDLVTAENPDLLAEDVYRNVEHLGRQLQLLQYGSWFFGPGAASPINLYDDPAFEWNERFQVLRDRGVPFEEAFSYWRKEYQEEWFKELAESKELPVSYMNSVSTYRDKGFDLLPAIAAADRDLRAKGFEPTVRLREEWMREELKLSVFRQGKTTKTSIAAQWQTEAAHEWTLENRDWVSAYPYAAPFFIPRGSSLDDTEYSSEARSLQVAMQLREINEPEEFIRSVYTSAASIPYYQQSLEHQRRLAAYRARGANAEIEYENKIWDEWKNSYLRSHPVFHNTMFSQDSKARRTQTVDQFRLILADEKVPEGEHRDDVLAGMALVVGFEDRMDRLFGLTSGAARDKRNKVRFEYNTRFNELIKNRPWLYEMYYNLFVPLISEAWIVKLEAGQYDDLGIYA
mgnify:CR=1 FL=1